MIFFLGGAFVLKEFSEPWTEQGMNIKYSSRKKEEKKKSETISTLWCSALWPGQKCTLLGNLWCCLASTFLYCKWISCNMQMVHSIIGFSTASVHKNTYRVPIWKYPSFPQLETVLFVFFSMNTETLDCLENPFDVRGLWMCRLGRHAFTLVLQSCYQLCFVFARGDMVPCFCGLELQSFSL